MSNLLPPIDTSLFDACVPQPTKRDYTHQFERRLINSVSEIIVYYSDKMALRSTVCNAAIIHSVPCVHIFSSVQARLQPDKHPADLRRWGPYRETGIAISAVDQRFDEWARHNLDFDAISYHFYGQFRKIIPESRITTTMLLSLLNKALILCTETAHMNLQCHCLELYCLPDHAGKSFSFRFYLDGRLPPGSQWPGRIKNSMQSIRGKTEIVQQTSKALIDLIFY